MWSLPLFLLPSQTGPHLFDLGPWFLMPDSHCFYFFNVYPVPTSDKIVRMAVGRKSPCFTWGSDLTFPGMLSSMSRRQKIGWLYSDHESLPESVTQPCMQEKIVHQERQRWRDGERAQRLSELSSERHRLGGRMLSRGDHIQRNSGLGLILSLSCPAYCLAIQIICASSQSFTF